MTTEVKDAKSLFRALAWREMARYYLDEMVCKPRNYDVILQCILEAEYSHSDVFVLDRVQMRRHARLFVQTATSRIEDRDLPSAFTCPDTDMDEYIKAWVKVNYTPGKMFS